MRDIIAAGVALGVPYILLLGALVAEWNWQRKIRKGEEER